MSLDSELVEDHLAGRVIENMIENLIEKIKCHFKVKLKWTPKM